MRVHYTGAPSGLTPTKEKQIQTRLTRIGKMLDKKGEKEGHIILTAVRRQRKAEITVNHHHHNFAGMATANDDFTALASAIDKLEKQIIRQADKWRTTTRHSGSVKQIEDEPIVEPEEAEPEVSGAQIFRPILKNNRKPMTADEAVLAITEKQNYLVYRDADSGTSSVVIRRADGNFDLIELA